MIENTPKVHITSKTFNNFKNGVILDILREVNQKYEYWDKVKYRVLPENISNTDFWSVVKLSRRANYLFLKFGRYEFNFYLTDSMLRTLHLLDQNTGGYLGANSFIPETNKDYYLYSSLMEEAIASSKMEGAATTRKLAKKMLREKSEPKNNSERMIFNNYATINYIKTVIDQPLSEKLICNIHRMIANNTMDDKKDEGCFRTNNEVVVANGIDGNVVHIPPKHKEIGGLIDDLCRFCNDEDKKYFIHPIIKGIILHFMLAYIHPFSDGNGRTSRALFYWYIIKHGYWLTEFLSISRIINRNKSKYEKSFLYTEMDENDISYFIQYNLSAMEQAFDALKLYIQRKMDHQQILQIPGINERQSILINLFSDKPNTMLSVKEVQNRFGIANVTARTDILKLVELNLVKAIAANKVRINYVRSENFEQVLKSINKSK